MKINVEVEIEPFSTPNYVRRKTKGSDTIVSDDGDGGDGVRVAIPLCDLSVSDLDSLCYEFKVNVFKKAGKQLPTMKR